jgi:hypothetical protein
MIPLITRCHLSDTAGEPGPGLLKLSETLFLTCALWIVYHNQCLLLGVDLATPRERPSVDGEICYDGST